MDIHIEVKNLAKSIAFIIIITTITSCDGILDESPKNVSSNNFYKTADEIETAINAIYDPLRDFRAEQIAVLSAHTDWGYGRGSRADYNDFSGFNQGNISVAGTRWEGFYESIRNANIVIERASESDVSASEVESFIAEAKFLRALSYFDLVRNWGGVPIRTEDTIDETDVPREAVDQVYDLILADLAVAEANLPEEPKHIGRPTTWAAKTMLADVYLNLERYSDARDKANEVIQSGYFDLVPVSSKEDYQWDVFGPEITTTPEEVFYFKYIRDTNEGNWINFVLNHPSTGYFNHGGAYAQYSDASNPFYMNWEDGDIRKELWDQIDFGLSETTLVSSKYIDPSAVGTSGAGNDLPIYRYSEVLLMYAEADARVDGGPTTEAMEALNKVHRRAYGFDPSSSSDVDFNISNHDESSFLDLILQERGYEFIYEGKRWLTLKRVGRAQEFVMENRGITVAERHYLWPIPESEFEYNDGMDSDTDQNPGY